LREKERIMRDKGEKATPDLIKEVTPENKITNADKKG